MRTIRFRGYDKIADGWCIGTPVKDKDVKGRFWIMFNEVDGSIIDDPKTIGQYTGLKDKNGTEIYEGDVDDNGYVVEYDESLSSFICVDEESDEWYHLCDLHTEFDGMNIIGNIHQNKELIKTK